MDRMVESSTSSIPNSDRVINQLKATGALEKLRTQAIQHLEQDDALRQSIEAAVLGSRAFQTFTGDQSNRQLTSQLQLELGADLSREALRTLWHVLSDSEAGISQQIDDAIRGVLCRQHEEDLQQQPAGTALAATR